MLTSIHRFTPIHNFRYTSGKRYSNLSRIARRKRFGQAAIHRESVNIASVCVELLSHSIPAHPKPQEPTKSAKSIDPTFFTSTTFNGNNKPKEKQSLSQLGTDKFSISFSLSSNLYEKTAELVNKLNPSASEPIIEQVLEPLPEQETKKSKREIQQPSKKKRKSLSKRGMSLQLTTVSHPTSDITQSSVMILTSNTGTRNLVGSIPEGLQRRCNEMGTRISRLQNIFMSGILDWSRIGGLPGMILTIADQGVKDLGICHSGNKNILKYMISNWRFFVFRFGINLTVHDELPPHEPYKCDGFNMFPINIEPSSLSDTPKKGTFLQKEEEKLNSVTHSKLTKMIDFIFPKPGVNSSNPPGPNKYICNVELPSTVKNEKISTSWIMQGDEIRGRFLPQKAKELGCKVEHFKVLCSGKSVTLDDGTVVLPHQVLEPNRMFPPILFLDIPSEDHLDPVLKYNWMKELESVSGADGVKRYGVIYHFIGDDMHLLLDDPKYVEFIKSFGEETIHFFGSKEYVPNTLNYVTSFRENPTRVG
ncbi:unnamed protein product [Ambrosiozyma monospora]|uniref:ribonuclease Z n=1 Tax=Ambrosiozyma monospora TaxID=43982 RepID=A0A9W6YYX1_AMBMO|nr:unnamed protein product [Ambrosiozyma monospora]